ILLQERIAITPESTAASLGWDAARVGAPLLVKAVELVGQGAAPRIPQLGGGTYLSWPKAADMRRLRERGRRYGLVPALWKALSYCRRGAVSAAARRLTPPARAGAGQGTPA